MALRARLGLPAVLILVAGSLGASARASGSGSAIGQADELQLAYADDSNGYASTLFPLLARARRDCERTTATKAIHYRYIFEQSVEAAMRLTHDVLPFSEFAGRVAALENKPAPLVALSSLYTRDASLIAPLSAQSPTTPQAEMSFICSLFGQWRARKWSIYWVERMSRREFAAAHVDEKATNRIAHMAIPYATALQKNGATYNQALDLTGVTLNFA